MFKESVLELEKAYDLSGGIPFAMVNLAWIYYRKGRKAEAEKLFNRLEKMAKDEYVPASFIYIIHRLRGNMDLGYKWLKKACEDHDIYLPYHLIMVEDCMVIPYDKKSAELLKKVGLVKKGT